jgi:RNA polymerase sigma factor (sigma-70 family)
LVRECRDGNQAAWSTLIEKYKNLIFSVPIKFGLSRDDSADVFQAVCLNLLSDLPNLREPRALPKWLMQTTYHKCLLWKKQRLTLLEDTTPTEESEVPAVEQLPDELLQQLEREQLLRETIGSLSPRCARMVRMLFFEDPPRPYQDVAKELGIATGSIGFIRGRCLKKLRQQLDAEGFR